MSAIEYAGYALAVNFSILIVPGQIFFLIIQEAGRSREDAMLAALGIVLAEVVLLLILFMGFTIYLHQVIHLLRLVGAILLFILGVQSIMRYRQPAVLRTGRPGAAAFYRGFLMTTLNPPFILWLFTVGLSVLDIGYSTLGIAGYLIFAMALLGSSLTVVFILIMAVSAGRNILGQRGLRILSLISGVAFIVLGSSLIYPLLTTS